MAAEGGTTAEGGITAEGGGYAATISIYLEAAAFDLDARLNAGAARADLSAEQPVHTARSRRVTSASLASLAASIWLVRPPVAPEAPPLGCSEPARGEPFAAWLSKERLLRHGHPKA